MENPLTAEQVKSVRTVSCTELQEWMRNSQAVQVIDVREPYEYMEHNIDGILIPL